MSEPTYIEIDELVLTGDQTGTLLGTNAVTKSYVDIHITSAVDALVASAPGTLNTLKEIADALGNDANLASVLTTSINAVSASVTAEAVRATASEVTEKARAETAEASLSAALSAEEATRVAWQSAEEAVRVSDLSAETSARESAVSDVSFLLQEESSSRVSGENALNGRVDDEKKVSSDAVSAEASARESAVSDLSFLLQEESSSRVSGENALNVRVDDEKKVSSDAVSAEASARESADSAEASARASADALKFDKSGGSVSGEVTLDSYLNFGSNWRVKASADGSRIVFEYLRAGVWRSAVPFISKSA